MTSISGLRVAVTGAGGGLGSALVQHLVNGNALVFAIDRQFASNSVGDECRIVADLSVPEVVGEVVGTLADTVDALDLLVNCAGVFLPDSRGSEAVADIDALLANNLTGVSLLTLGLQSLLRLGNAASVVNIGSTDGVVASAGQNSEVGVCHDLFYAASKGALITFTRALAMRWAPDGVRVNVVCPTIFRSPMTSPLLDMPGKDDQLSSHIPMGRLATTVDVIDAVLGLHAMRFTTGHMLPVDGGYLCQ